nr:hypothetical protein [Tanacetum cinerariifolium]
MWHFKLKENKEANDKRQRELLRNKEEVNLNASDVDTDEIYVMKLRWRGNYYNLIGKWGKIVRRKGLGAGKEIKIRWANGSLNFYVPYEPVVVQTSMPVMMSHHHDEWPIRKVLTLSDAREHLRNEHQINVNARDDGTGDVFLMKLKWQGSYYNLIRKWGQIIRRKTLEVGQEIRVRWDNGYKTTTIGKLADEIRDPNEGARVWLGDGHYTDIQDVRSSNIEFHGISLIYQPHIAYDNVKQRLSYGLHNNLLKDPSVFMPTEKCSFHEPRPLEASVLSDIFHI